MWVGRWQQHHFGTMRPSSDPSGPSQKTRNGASAISIRPISVGVSLCALIFFTMDIMLCQFEHARGTRSTLWLQNMCSTHTTHAKISFPASTVRSLMDIRGFCTMARYSSSNACAKAVCMLAKFIDVGGELFVVIRGKNQFGQPAEISWRGNRVC